VFDLDVDLAADVADVDPGRADVAPATAVLALLEQHLAWHGVTLVEVMRATRAGADAGPWIDALVQNSADMTATVGLVYGPVGARAFGQQWAQHTQFLVDHAVAVGNGDDDAAALAEESLATYARDAGSFFETATGGALPADAVQGLLQTHVDHMVDLTEAEHAGDDVAALGLALTDNEYLFGIAAGLAGAITGQFPTVFPGSLDTPDAAFCTIEVRDGTAALITDLMGEAPDGSRASPAADQFADVVSRAGRGPTVDV
jgi:hypothetical protein